MGVVDRRRSSFLLGVLCLALLAAALGACTRKVQPCPDAEGVASPQSGSSRSLGNSRTFEPWIFVENKGQILDSKITFYARYQGRVITFGKRTVGVELPGLTKGPGTGVVKPTGVKIGGGTRIEFGDVNVAPTPLGRLDSYSNFYLGADPDNWREHVPHYERLVYVNIYPHIDLIFFFDEQRRLTFEYHVRPGGDPAHIVMRYSGVQSLWVTEEGHVLTRGNHGILRQSIPVTYQDHGDHRERVPSENSLKGSRLLAFHFPKGFDPSRELVIDPTLEFSTYWGSRDATNRTVSIDPEGNVYMAGGSPESNWPSTLGRRHCGGFDVTVAKFDPQGNLLWSTLLGGPQEDYAYVSAVSEKGELYLSGRAGEGFPTTAGAFDRTFNGGLGGGGHSPTDAFVTKLSPDGRIVYSTYIGGNGDDNGRAIHLLPSGKLIIGGGNSTSDDLPTDQGTNPGPVLKPRKGGLKDSWIALVSADGASLEFCTYFGPSDDRQRYGDETIRALGVDSRLNIWIGGTTHGSDITPTQDAFQKQRGMGQEAYIAKLSSDGEKLVYFSWLGGDGVDEIETEGVSDTKGNFYVAGSTDSMNFPTSPGAFQSQLSGKYGGGWTAKISDEGRLVVSTLYGGTVGGAGGFFGPVVDRTGNIYVTGPFRCDDCPLTADAYQTQRAGAVDSVMAVFSPDGKELLYGSYFGGTHDDVPRHIGIHPNGTALYIIGLTGSTDIPIVNGFQSTPAGTFLVKFSLSLDRKVVEKQ